jgi:hypothetical protein
MPRTNTLAYFATLQCPRKKLYNTDRLKLTGQSEFLTLDVGVRVYAMRYTLNNKTV